MNQIPNRPITPGYLTPARHCKVDSIRHHALSRTGLNRTHNVLKIFSSGPPPLPPRPTDKKNDEKLLFEAARILMEQSRPVIPKVEDIKSKKIKKYCCIKTTVTILLILCFVPVIYHIIPSKLLHPRTKKQIQTVSLSPIPRPTQNIAMTLFEGRGLSSLKPTMIPTSRPTFKPSFYPTTQKPSNYPTTKNPIPVPSYLPTNIPTYMPSVYKSPTQMPTSKYRKVYNFQQFIDALRIDQAIIDIRENIFINSSFYIKPGRNIKIMSSEGINFYCQA